MPKIYGNEVLQLETKFLKGNFRVGFVYRVGKTEISHGDRVLSRRYSFFRRKITEQNSVLLVEERSRLNSVEEITLQVPSLIWTYSVCYFYRPVTQVNQ